MCKKTRMIFPQLVKSFLSNYCILKVKPTLSLFLLRYLRKFRVMNLGGTLILHSHLPPLNSKAYTRFVKEHLLGKTEGPSHAQIGLTNACPQNCRYCYNKNRKGTPMDTETIIRLIRDLKEMGMIWLGFTGGEPLLNKEIVRITESAGTTVALKLFTTGCTLTRELAKDLQRAGLQYVSISLDHWEERKHDEARGYSGAFRTALKAIELFKETTDLHVSVSSVISWEMIHSGQVEEFLQFLIRLNVQEAWLSEVKPAVPVYWDPKTLFTEADRRYLCGLQDRYNKDHKITVNYLGHFEGRENFGCNAGHKMVYIDAFGEVSPCVFTPMTFGNVQETPVKELFHRMKQQFPSEESCFIHRNYPLFQKYMHGGAIVTEEDSYALMREVRFGPFSQFSKLYYG
ncbi:MAG: radical SAM protein [Spirochaetes bacterium]|nr:radical SAM protein [Spirochaetota bacterium]